MHQTYTIMDCDGSRFERIFQALERKKFERNPDLVFDRGTVFTWKGSGGRYVNLIFNVNVSGEHYSELSTNLDSADAQDFAKRLEKDSRGKITDIERIFAE